MSVAEWADTYGIHYWRIFWSSDRKLVWVGFEHKTTEFRFLVCIVPPLNRISLYLSRIQSECWKIRTRKTPNPDTFHADKMDVNIMEIM